MQYNLIWELMLFKFEQGHNVAEMTKNICCVKGKCAVDLNHQTRSGRPKIVF